MRKKVTTPQLSLQIIAGSHTVLLSMNMEKHFTKNLLGFAIQRKDHSTGHLVWLKTPETFEPCKDYSTAGLTKPPAYINPIQAFLWGDYTVLPCHTYTYTVMALYGKPLDLHVEAQVYDTITTEDPFSQKHGIFFNRGVAGSQAYARKFNNLPPQKVADRAAYKWLSRGLEEAILHFISQAQDSSYSLHVAAYEFCYPPVVQAFAQAKQRGVNVKIIYDKRREPSIYQETEKIAAQYGLTENIIPRQQNPSYISHNKFILLLQDQNPLAVWTGSTNFTEGGIFGQSNVGHTIREKKIAHAYLHYWQRLAQDPTAQTLRHENQKALDLENLLDEQEPTTQPIFSPLPSDKMLHWYVAQAAKAKQAIFFTAAFGVNKVFADLFSQPSDVLRYILLEKKGNTYDSFSHVANNRIALGSSLREGTQEWLAENITGLNNHVEYIHTKYMIIDPLGENPMVINGSANFSYASVHNNDENMLVIYRNTRVADLFLTEFMSLFKHFYARSKMLNILSSQQIMQPNYLKSDDNWTLPYYNPENFYYKERNLFNATT
ncbi:MAG: phospholipase D-like domain-containing protein [Bacteroidota bacterium]